MEAQNICRVCLKLKEESVDLFDERNERKVADLVKQICPITIDRNENEKFPKFVCTDCLEIIINAVHLQNLSLMNDQKLRRKFKDEDELEKAEIVVDEDETEIIIEALDEAMFEDEIETVENTVEAEEPPQMVSPKREDKKSFSSSSVACELCGVSFFNVSSFKRHMKRKHKEISYSCDFCNGDYKTKRDLEKHLSSSHSIKLLNPEISNYNNLVFDKSKIESLEGMYEQLVEPFGISCCFCIHTDYDEESLNNHMALHQNVVDTGKMFCNQCPSLILTMEEMIQHAKTHNSKINTHRCLVCDKVFPFDQKFIGHLRHHKKTEKTTCCCSECGRKFKKPKLLEDHIRFIHNKEALHNCSHCGQGFGSKSALNGHLRRHTEKYECPFCQKLFSSPHLLKSHKNSHSTERPFPCTVCDLRFKHKKVLSSHMKLHTNEQTLFICNICDKALNSAFALSRHKLTHTGSRPHECEFCDKSYSQKSDLNKHLRSHLGENTYFCQHIGCEQSFRLIAELRIHETHCENVPLT